MEAKQLKGIEAVLFDLDGTLFKSPLDFSLIKKVIGVPAESSILEYIYQLPSAEQPRAWKILNAQEREAASKAELYPGAEELISFLEGNRIKKAIVTRNSRNSVEIMLERHPFKFDAIVTREDTEPKPSPKPMLLASRLLGVKTDYLLNVGDYKWDLLAGKNAGIFSILILHEKYREEFISLADGWVASLIDLITFIKSYNSKNLSDDPHLLRNDL